MNFEGAAARFREIAQHCEEGLAVEACRAAANDYVTVLRMTVPVETGALRDSVHLWRVWGDGRQAEAIAGPNIVYADFRDRGGTIRIRRAKVLSDGERFFGKQVTQEGSHYMLRAKVSSEGPIANACRLVVDKFISLEG